MRNYPAILLTLLLALLICSCSVEVEQTAAIPSPEDTSIAATSVVSGTQVPITWAHLDLTGKLVFLSSATEGDQLTSSIQMLNLTTGELATIFNASQAWIFYATVSPDAKMLAMSYIPPAQSNSSWGRSLYIMPLDASTGPQPLLTQPTPDDHYTQAEWAPDGEHIYHVHYNSKRPNGGQLDPIYDILRTRYSDGQTEQIVDHAFWPRISPDSSKIVYVFVDPDSGKNELVVANADGSNSRRVPLAGSRIPEVIDAPIFSPDGQTILFSAPEPGQAYQPNFLEQVMRIQVAKAHNVPSDWWSVPVSGGMPIQLTQLKTINLFASLSPDRRRIASLSGEGVFVMDLDGSNLTQLISNTGVHGTVSWIP
jgi:Tol biopolymer transport system component